MELILWRHAEAEDTTPDMARVLTAKGHKQAEKMAAWLRPRLPSKTHILVSPAQRTQQTAAALGLDFSTLEALAPGASVQAVIQAVGWPTANGAVLVIGHQPTLGMVAAYAMTGKSAYWSIKKGAIWWISSRVRAGGEQTILRAVLSPDLI
jgi:phosphohistidine phosphatase